MKEPVRVVTLKSRPIWYALSSLGLLLPCYWQSRIQAGDLSSHLYNAWLAQMIQSGRVQGLQIARQTTNVLFDLILRGLFQWLGPAWAQRFSVSLCVLIFAWGAFAFVSAVAGRSAWHLLPCIAVLAYGWVFHMGFFNFYLSLGLCFWSLAAIWKPRPARTAGAAVILVLAYTAHALPVLWSAGLIAYGWAARRIPDRLRTRLMILGLALLGGGHFALSGNLFSRWSVWQMTSATGADQVLVFDAKYVYLLAALLLFWATCVAEMLFTQEPGKVARSIPLHWCVLTAAGIFILPNSVLIPGFRHSLVYIAERMSLAVGICFCVLIGSTRLHGIQRLAPIALALLFFAFLFRDERHLNRFEDRLEMAVAQLPPGQRVISPILDSDLRASALTHMVDRACIGRCYSFANYEPSTAQFRIRATQPNQYVIADYDDSFDMQNGRYIFKPTDLPVYALEVSKTGQIATRSMKAGMASGTSAWHALRNP